MPAGDVNERRRPITTTGLIEREDRGRGVELRAARSAAYVEAAAFTLLGADRPGIIVALHGLSATRHQPEAYLEGFDMPELGLLAPDLRGHGETEILGEAEAFGPAQLGADVQALVRHLGLGSRRIVVLGISIGATVALELVRQAALDIVAAILIRPAHAATPAQHLRVNHSIAEYLRQDPERALERLVAGEEYRHVATVSERAAASLRDKVTADRAAERAARLAEGATWTAFAPGERFERAPAALIVAARNDPLHPRSVAEDWHRRIAGSQLAELPSRDADPVAYAALARSTVQAFLASRAPSVVTAR
jgi:pimeloyl-ACP methyl ester carboxylesterase